MSIMEYNGGACVAMTGKNCVAIASDLRFGVQAQTMNTNMPKTYKVTDRCFIGLTGLATDCLTVAAKIKFRTNLYKLREDREIKPSTLTNLISSLLYEKRFGPYYCEPIICGLEGKDNKPFISSMDLIGAIMKTEDFVVIGSTASEALFGLCESMYRNDMAPEDLFETISQCLLAAVDRDAVSGWGGVCHIITPEGVTTKFLKGRQD
eukprot:TRINITY_DN14290_c0_g1_i1.p1 TRINITY_DN14290_c0_g1~~TRINITY_DN14290_c0_g1_i1.p1  ORF type:complete len:233 (+),score=34.66 TRINITY_DN14290_c0_g1_i1:81-701(+)